MRAGAAPPPPEVIVSPFRIPYWIELEQRGSDVVISGPSATTRGTPGRIDATGVLAWEDSATVPGPATRSQATLVHFGGSWQLRPGASGLRGSRTLAIEERVASTGAVVGRCSRSMSLDLVRHTAPVPELNPGSCADEASLRSGRTGAMSAVDFRNASTEPTQLFYVDSTTRRVHLGDIAPGDSLGVYGYASIAFVLTDARGTCLRTYLVTQGGPATATYHGPPRYAAGPQ